MAYFWTPKPIGLNADIERHRQAEQGLKDNIKELEDKVKPLTYFDEVALRVYKHHLNLLWESKAKVLEQLGRKQLGRN